RRGSARGDVRRPRHGDRALPGAHHRVRSDARPLDRRRAARGRARPRRSRPRRRRAGPDLASPRRSPARRDAAPAAPHGDRAGAAAALSSLGYARVIELSPGADLELRGVQVVAEATAHGAGELAHGLAYVLRGDGPSIYLCGDSGYFSGFADLGARFAPDVAA